MFAVASRFSGVGGRVASTKVAVALVFRARFGDLVAFATGGLEFFLPVWRRPLPGFALWFLSIHIHIPSQETTKTHEEANERAMPPVHWGTFDLGNHEWDGPINRTIAAAEKAVIQLITLKLGAMVDPTIYRNINWWDGID